MRSSALLLAAVLASCESTPTGGELLLVGPQPIRILALTAVSDLTAAAQLVPRGGMPEAPIDLARGDDGVSFSGFIPAAPGEYTLEVVFAGFLPGEIARGFLGRWVSDALTVESGEVEARFSRSLDRLGRPEDQADSDGDGFGRLDEFYFETDPTRPDSDGDGLNDGQDCDPADASLTYRIQPQGSIEDCDGDREKRAQLPYGGGGGDCNDRDPSIPNAMPDDCGDDLDTDCNPVSCPPADGARPTITDVSPGAGSSLGCQATISAIIRDDSAVTSALLVFTDDPIFAGIDRTLPMRRVDGDRFESSPLNLVAGSGFRQGSHPVEIRATDDRGNTGILTLSYDLRMELPQIDRFSPATLGAQNQPFMVEIDASAPSGVTSLRLLAAPKGTELAYDQDLAQELGLSTTGQGRFEVDPARFGSVDQLLYAVVSDSVGNKLEPYGPIYTIARPTGLTIQTYYACLGGAGPEVPARILTPGQSAFRPARMRELYDRSIALAAAVDPGARLTSVQGSGLRSDGTVELDDATSFIRQWLFAFWNLSAGRGVTVTWHTPASPTQSPLVDPMPGNISEAPPIENPSVLADSDVVAQAFAAAGCGALTGDPFDQITYRYFDDQSRDVVQVLANGKSFMANAMNPTQVIFGCP